MSSTHDNDSLSDAQAAEAVRTGQISSGETGTL